MANEEIAEKNALMHAHQHGNPLQPQTDPMMAIVREALTNPQIDVDKLERMVAMVDKRAEHSLEMEAEAAFNAAMSVVQSKMRRIATDASNSQTKSKYATFAALDRAIRPLYSESGLALSYNTEEGAPPDHIRLVCFVTHTAPEAKRSHTRKYHVDMPADGKGAKGGDVMTKTHAAGSAYSYGQRYLLRMIFNIAVGEDDDGNKAGSAPVEKAGPEEIAQMEQAIAETKTDITGFLDLLRVESIADMDATTWNIGIAWLDRKKATLAKKAGKTDG